MTDPASEHPCPCCGCRTLPEAPPGTFYICPVCGWEDDAVQFSDQNFSGGANSVSLAEARRNYSKFGASNRDCLNQVREPYPGERE